jgi:hypothetical protein
MPEVAILIYEGMTTLDVIGPYEVLARLPDAEVKLVASTPGPKKTEFGLALTAESALEDVPAPDIIVIPKVITAAGVSAGIDMALTLASREGGADEARSVQLMIEYDPQPPFDSGSLEKADPETQRHATEILMAGVV